MMIAALPHAPARTAAHQDLDLNALARWLRPRLALGVGDLQATRIDGGQSNPSWLLRSPEQAWVLRAKPGPAAELLPSAHAIEREFRVLQALQGSDVPVPKTHLLCEDESVMGAAFYLMDFVDGRIFRDATLPEVPVAQRKTYYEEANRVLAALHRVDWRAAGLQDFGRHEGYFGRLIRRWTQQYRASVDAPIEAMEHLAAWLPAHIPAGAEGAEHTCITHGDFRMENLMFHPDQPRIVAVLDWELSTLGHPLGDLAYNCLAWHLPSGLLRGYGDQDLAALGLPSEHDYIARYCQRTGHTLAKVLADWPFYIAFNLFRLAAILQGIGRRAREGTASSQSAQDIAAMAIPVANKGWSLACK